MKTETKSHTPGPIESVDLEISTVSKPWLIVTNCNWHDSPGFDYYGGDPKSNARLLAAAYTSYDKHCGELAIECAEGDLLGELLEACQAIAKFSFAPAQLAIDVIAAARQLVEIQREAESAIAKATGDCQ